MRIRWHKSWLVASLVGGCALNPQPELPDDRGTGAGTVGASGTTSAAGGSAIVVTPSAGGSDAGAPSIVPPSGSEAGTAGASAEAGAAGDGGAAQLAPGRTK